MTEAATRPPASFIKEQRAHAQQLRLGGASIESVNTALKERAEKCGYGWDDGYAYVSPSPYVPLGGATSFAAYDDYRRAVLAEAEVNELTWTFHDIMDNIFASSMSLGEKAAAVLAAASDLQSRLGDVPAETEDGMKQGTKEERSAGLLTRILGRTKKEAPAAVPVGETPAAGLFRTYKDANGDYRWFAIYSNCFKDVDGETFSYEAHKAYVDYVDATKDFPELWLFHVPGTKAGKADLVDLTDDGFMVASGTYDTGKMGLAEALAEQGPWQVSHGFDYVKERGLVNGVYQPGYKTFEISPLPVGKAANPLTGFVPNQEEIMSLTPWKKDALSKLGIDVEGIEKGLAAASQKAKEAGHEITFKELAEAIETKEAPATETKDADASAAAAPGSLTLNWDADGFAVQIKEVMASAVAPVTTAIEAIQAKQKEQDEIIAQLQKSDDEKIAATLSPRARPGGGFVASESKDTEADGRGADVKRAKEGLEVLPPHLQEYDALIPGLKESYAAAAARSE